MDAWLDVARRHRQDGLSDDETARALIQAGAPPVDVIKAMRSALGVTLDDAKILVHRNLPLRQQRAAERLWDEAEASLSDDPEPPIPADRHLPRGRGDRVRAR